MYNKTMDLIFYIAYLLIWLCGCGCIPRAYQGTGTSDNSTVPFPHPRLGGSMWTSNDSRHREPYRNPNRGSGSIVFPTDDPEPRLKLPPIKSCPKGSKYCEESDDYPSAYIEGLIQNSAHDLKALFGEDLDGATPNGTDIEQRVGSSDDEGSPLCESKVEIIFPKKAEDKNGNLKYVVNFGDYKQGIRVETCISEEQTCKFSELFPSGYKVYCQQRYLQRKLIALNDNKSLDGMYFTFPSCCMCVTKLDTAKRRYAQTPAPRSPAPS